MANIHKAGIESNASLFHHPLHPLMVPLPIASLIGALVSDFVFLATSNPFWSQASFWLIAAGIVTGLGAGAVGAIDYLTINAVRHLQTAQLHAMGNVAAITVALINLALRWFDPAVHIKGWGLVLSLITVGILGGTGWLGGALSYKYRIGQIAPEHGGQIPGTEIS